MEASFWHNKWESNQIGFHEGATNPGLLRHFDKLGLPAGSRIFVPLCGKTLDIHWLLAQGFKVVGAELSELAVKQLFEELNILPMVEDAENGKIYTAQGIQIFVGDIFNLDSTRIGRVDGIYDRAALVALPAAMRTSYTAHLRALSSTAPQLLVTFDYDQAVMDGPPFSVDSNEVKSHYADYYSLTLVQNSQLDGGLKGWCPARVNIWTLLPA